MKQTQKYLVEQERIARIAFQLFAETGYAKTPLSVIGKAAGVQKSLLQYYFPKKSKFIELFIETSFGLVIDQVIESIRAREAEADSGIDPDLEVVDPFDDDEEEFSGLELVELLYDIAYFEFWYITSCPSTEALRMDVMESYGTAQLVVQCICDWIFDHMADLDDELKERIYDTITFCVGGGFEYACMKSERKEPVDVEYIVDNAMQFVVSALGFDPSLFQIKKEISTEWLLRTADAVDAKTFGA
ncbi:MAG: TetR/AcrR family transcriptional regulator [Clostridia bacterium]|nr:TetR/AcrR family transcriptional regulator [Clostridia bacterium]